MADPRLVIAPAQVHLWHHVHRGGAAAGEEALLSADELARAARLVDALDRERFVDSHLFLRRVLAHELGCEVGDLELGAGRNGKPVLTGLTGSRLSFNMSHSGGCTVVACTVDVAIGVDVETVRPFPEWPAVADRVLSPGERAMVDRLPASSQVHAFLRLWTRKEAAVKASGSGIDDSLPTFEGVPLADDGVSTTSPVRLDGALRTLVELTIDDDLPVAIVVHGPVTDVCRLTDDDLR